MVAPVHLRSTASGSPVQIQGTFPILRPARRVSRQLPVATPAQFPSIFASGFGQPQCAPGCHGQCQRNNGFDANGQCKWHGRGKQPDDHLQRPAECDLRSESDHARGDGQLDSSGDLHGDRPGDGAGSTLSITGAGTVKVTASQAGNSDYAAATSVTQSFTVNPAALTVTANNASRPYGAANPAFSYTLTGFVGTDTSSVVSGTATETTTATSTSAVGTYPITFSTESLTASNYTFTYVSGTLTISGGASQTITFNALPNVTYGASPITLGATASSTLPVTYTVTGPATVSGSTLSITGAGSVTVTASQAGNSDYAAATSVSQSFTVAKAALTVTANNASIQYGQAIPTPGLHPHRVRERGHLFGSVGYGDGDDHGDLDLGGGDLSDHVLDGVPDRHQLHLQLCERDADHQRRCGADDHLQRPAECDLRSESDHARGDGQLDSSGDLHGDRPGDGVGLDAEHHRRGHSEGDGQPGGQQRLCGGHFGDAELHGEPSRPDSDRQ